MDVQPSRRVLIVDKLVVSNAIVVGELNKAITATLEREKESGMTGRAHSQKEKNVGETGWGRMG